MECRHLLSRVFVGNPEQVVLLLKLFILEVPSCISFPVMLIFLFMQRITIPEIKNHPWFLKNMPIEMTDDYQQKMKLADLNTPDQSLEEVMTIIQEARKPGNEPKVARQVPCPGSMDLDDIDFDDIDDIDIENSGDFVCAM
jgi:serine/threonine-protein kinase SRK2